MPLLTMQEIETMFPLFGGPAGNFLGRILMRLLSVDKINDLYDRHVDERGPDFARTVLEEIGVRYEIENKALLNMLPEGTFITISNHPYGSLDGLMLVDIFGHIRSDYKVMVNKILSRIDTMGDNFICVSPKGDQDNVPDGDSISGVRDAIRHVREGHPLGIMPSGAISDFSLRDFDVGDREWQDSVVRLIRKLHVPIIPVAFRDRNSSFYYSLGLLSWKIRMLRLPAEVFNKRDRPEHILLGDIITPECQEKFDDLKSFSDFLRNSVYDLIK